MIVLNHQVKGNILIHLKYELYVVQHDVSFQGSHTLKVILDDAKCIYATGKNIVQSFFCRVNS